MQNVNKQNLERKKQIHSQRKTTKDFEYCMTCCRGLSYLCSWSYVPIIYIILFHRELHITHVMSV